MVMDGLGLVGKKGMSLPTRFQARRDAAIGALIKDNKTSRIVATFPPDSDHPGMARKFAAAADEFNRMHEKRLASLKKMGR